MKIDEEALEKWGEGVLKKGLQEKIFNITIRNCNYILNDIV